MSTAQAPFRRFLGGSIAWTWVGLRSLVGLAMVAAALSFAWTFPTAPLPLSLGLLAYTVLLVVYPSAWLIVVPALLPVLDLSYWSGRVFLTEYDFLLMITVGASLWRRGNWISGLDRTLCFLAALLVAGNVLVTWHGLQQSSVPGVASWTGYLSSANALREAKGFFWALLLLPVLGLERIKDAPTAKLFSIGMMLGLAFAAGTVLWERLLFTGLLNFADPYRVSGWFFGMHTGGAAIDAYLMLSTPFLAAPLLLWPERFRLLSAPLALVAVYCLYVTYSRANYPAAAAMVLVLAAGSAVVLGWRPRSARGWLRAVGIVALGTLVLVALLLSGRNIQSRFAESLGDLGTRLDHWARIVGIMGDGPRASLIGMGRGVFPRAYFWSELDRGHQLAVVAPMAEDGIDFARLSKSDASGTLFLRQRFEPSSDGTYQLSITMRPTSEEPERLLIEFCERHMLKFLAECQWTGINLEPDNREWGEYHKQLKLGSLGREHRWLFRRPSEISIMNRGIKDGLDISSVQLKAGDGRPLLANPAFGDGRDHWFTSYGDHLRWHAKNVAVHVFFEAGAVGLVLFTVMLAVPAIRLARSIAARDPFAVLLAAALIGTLLVGAFDSLFDEPRITLLVVLMVWLAMAACRRAEAGAFDIDHGSLSGSSRESSTAPRRSRRLRRIDRFTDPAGEDPS